MKETTIAFWKEVLFKTFPPILLSLAVFLSTREYNSRQEEIKKIEIANDFFNEITEESEPTEAMLALKKEFIKRILKNEDPALNSLLDSAIKYNYQAKIARSKELYANATTQVEKAAALTELGNAIEKAGNFKNPDIHKLAEDNKQEYQQYKDYKKAEDLNKEAIQNLESGQVDSARINLKSAQQVYADYPGIKTAIKSVETDRAQLKVDPNKSQAKANELKDLTIKPVEEERQTMQEQIQLKRSPKMMVPRKN